MRRCAIFLVLIATSCAGNPLDGTGIECDPMAYQLDNEVWALVAGVRVRTSESGMVGVNPSVSPDGTHVAFASGEREPSLDLHVIDTDGSNLRLVWNDELIQSSVDWSPDGSTLVFDQYSERDGVINVPLQIFTIPFDGSRDPVQLTDGTPNGKPKWGSDERILFLSLRDGDEQEIYSMNPDGSDQLNLTNHPSGDVLAELSPDGSKFVFASNRAGNGDLDIWIMDADGSNVRQAHQWPGPGYQPDVDVQRRADHLPVGGNTGRALAYGLRGFQSNTLTERRMVGQLPLDRTTLDRESIMRVSGFMEAR